MVWNLSCAKKRVSLAIVLQVCLEVFPSPKTYVHRYRELRTCSDEFPCGLLPDLGSRNGVNIGLGNVEAVAAVHMSSDKIPARATICQLAQACTDKVSWPVGHGLANAPGHGVAATSSSRPRSGPRRCSLVRADPSSTTDRPKMLARVSRMTLCLSKSKADSENMNLFEDGRLIGTGPISRSKAYPPIEFQPL
jgi:hypothetical protein